MIQELRSMEYSTTNYSACFWTKFAWAKLVREGHFPVCQHSIDSGSILPLPGNFYVEDAGVVPQTIG